MNNFINIILVGENNCGKSWLFESFFNRDLCSIKGTIGFNYERQIFEIDGEKTKATIWDTAGHRQFRSLYSSFYEMADAIVCVYDITEYDSFLQIKEFWLSEVSLLKNILYSHINKLSRLGSIFATIL